MLHILQLALINVFYKRFFKTMSNKCLQNIYLDSIFVYKIIIEFTFTKSLVFILRNYPIQVDFIYFSINDNNFHKFILWREIILVPWRLPVNTLSIKLVTFYPVILYVSRSFEARMLVT